MRANARLFCVLWVTLSSVLWVVGCGGDAFEVVGAQPASDAASDGTGQDGADVETSMPDGGDADQPDAADDVSDGTPGDVAPDGADDAQDAQLEADVGEDADAPVTGLSLSPDPLDFGDQRVGVASAPMGLTIENSGQTLLPKPGLTFLGAHPNDFSLVSDSCPAGGLAPAASCIAQLKFTPSESGAREATVVVLAGTEVRLGSVRGNGLDPAVLSIDPTDVDFATVVVPNSSSPVSVKVTNIGGSNTPALTTAIEPTSSPFAITSNTCVGTQLSPGADCSISVAFKPVSAGSVTAALRVAGAGLTAVTTNLNGTGATAGQLAVSPPSGDLGSVTVGEAGAVQYFNVTNQGSSATGPLSVGLEGTNAADFTIASNGCTAALQGNQSCVVGVRLTPQTAGSKIATLLATATPGGAASSSLSGAGLRPAELAMVPTTQDFGTVAPGVTGGPFTFTVSNTGESKSGALTTSKAGVDASQFIIDSATTCGVALDPGASCVIVMRFKPTSDGQKAAVVHATAAPGGDVTATLTGFSGTPALAITPSTWDFGPLAIGTPSTVKQFTVTNTGTVQSGTPNVALIQVAPADYKIVSNTCTAALAPQGTCSVGIKFTPTATGPQAATLQVTADPGGSAVASLQGRGLTPAQLTLAPGSADFGTVPLNQPSAPIEFTLTNTGETATSALTLGLGGTNPGDFSYTSTCPTNLPLGGGIECSISVTFTPKAASVRQATLTASATTGGSVSSSLSGTGTSQAALTITPASHDYGSVAVGSTSSFTYAVKNTGGSQSGTLQMLLGDTVNFMIPPSGDGCTGITLNASATCNVVVTFVPQTAGTKDTALTAQASPGGTATASLSGYGLGPALLHLSPPGFSYPTVQVGSASAPVFFTLSNDGASASGPLTIALTGVDKTSYLLGATSGSACAAGSSLAPGATCTIGVTFAPTSYGVKTASLSVTATPGGSPSATLVGGTPDIFVSMTGDDNNDGRTMANAVRHITKALSMVSAGWTVHVAFASTAYGVGEAWPLTVTDGVKLRGEVTAEPYPIIEPPGNVSATTVVKLTGSAPWAEQLEIRSGSGTMSGSSRTVVQLTGADPGLDSCAVVCQADRCTAVEVTSSGSSKVTHTTATIKGVGTALRAAPTSGGQVRAELFTADCPEITDITTLNTIGVDASAGTLQLLSGKVMQCMHGVMLSSNGNLQMRDTDVLDSYLYGVEINLGNGISGTGADLGTATSPGNNTFVSQAMSSKVGLAVKSPSTTVYAAGNTWIAKVQGSDDQGHYAPAWKPGPVLEPAFGGSNYAITWGSSGIQF